MSYQDIMQALRALGRTEDIEKRVAAKGGPALQEALVKTLKAGTSPEGQAWAPKKTGGRAYADAASHVSVAVYGNLVRATLTAPEVFGHFGARGMPVRQMIPDAGAGTPASVARILEDAAQEVFEELTR